MIGNDATEPWSPLHPRRRLAPSSQRARPCSSSKKLARGPRLDTWRQNGAIPEAVDGEAKIHIVDISSTFCTQWPTLLEALATRSDDTPHLRLATVVVANKFVNDQTDERAWKPNGEVHLSEFDLNELDVKSDEVLAINCVGAMHGIMPRGNLRDAVMSNFRRLRPRIVTVVEEEADLVGEELGFDDEFLRSFGECLRWFRVCFESLEESFPRTSNERLMLERVAGRDIVDLVACEPSDGEDRSTARKWSRRMRNGGFGAVGYSDEVADDVRALLRRYKEGVWSMVPCSDATRPTFCNLSVSRCPLPAPLPFPSIFGNLVGRKGISNLMHMHLTGVGATVQSHGSSMRNRLLPSCKRIDILD
ncbi:LOW QUALITY PROTEIN: hypothetical protein HID58_040478 [Brassica napus]|uniref:Uncharacterized protein n=1 Tax=Brassica napus TaxID=3708 RepID=A0ABQ8B855_BRANA|nr:LOW QUALITY PROTEIN: hypothetical protein HID58_040478 [Brassica napus]